MSDQAGRDLMAIDARLFSAKGALDSLYQEIAEFLFPERADFTTDIVLGQEFAAHLTDATPVLMRRELGDQIGSMVRPDGRQWFKAAASNKRIGRDRDAASFLEFMTDVNSAILNSRDSGFRRAAQQVEHDFAAFGMGWLQVSYNRNRDNLIYRCHHPKNMAGQEGPDGQVNHVHRKCDMTAAAMAHLFGERDSSFAAGKQHVGFQIRKLISHSLSILTGESNDRPAHDRRTGKPADDRNADRARQ